MPLSTTSTYLLNDHHFPGHPLPVLNNLFFFLISNMNLGLLKGHFLWFQDSKLVCFLLVTRLDFSPLWAAFPCHFHFCSFAGCGSWRRSECFQSSPKGLHGAGRVPASSAAAIPANPNSCGSTEQFHHCLPSPYKYLWEFGAEKYRGIETILC